MTADRVLRFSLGPVQGFVAQARRTRDLWAGSFLLSWLSAHAMVAVRTAGGNIVFPVVYDDDLIKALEKHPTNPQPEIGTVPNQFKAIVPADFHPKACRIAVFDAWNMLCSSVRETFVAPVANFGNGTMSIWDRQCSGFWEVYWVIGDDPGNGTEGAWSEIRKNWRNHRLPVEEGDHCTLMGDWQEISGFVRARDKDKQDAFWKELRGPIRGRRAGTMDGLDLREGERLCAIALVKRLFPRLPEDKLRKAVRGWIPGGDINTVGRWPSTGHVAAAHWITAAESKFPDACTKYATHVQKNLHHKHRGERFTRVKCLDNSNFSALREIDSNLLHPDDVANDYALKLFDTTDTENESLRQPLLDALKEFIKTTKMGEPTPYYGLLLMDGDNVGELLSKHRGKESAISEALTDFTKEVKKRVADHNGVLIYAGGDDMLALSPIEDALALAADLARQYEKSFTTHFGKRETISGALVIADHHEPLRAVMEEAHRLLEDVAKDGNDRASLAVSVLKPSGRAVEWVAKWDSGAVGLVAKLTREMALYPQFSNKFIYNLRARYREPFSSRLGDLELTVDELKDVFRFELGKRRDETAVAAARDVVPDLWTMTRPRRPAGASAASGADFDENGLLLVRFLKQYAIWG